MCVNHGQCPRLVGRRLRVADTKVDVAKTNCVVGCQPVQNGAEFGQITDCDVDRVDNRVRASGSAVAVVVGLNGEVCCLDVLLVDIERGQLVVQFVSGGDIQRHGF